MHGFGHEWMYDGGGWGWMVFGWLWMVILALSPVLVIMALAKYLFSRRPEKEKSRAQEILEEAYARGEIKREEYLQKRADLQQK